MQSQSAAWLTWCSGESTNLSHYSFSTYPHSTTLPPQVQYARRVMQ